MAYPYTNSKLENVGGSDGGNKTSTSLSVHMLIKTANNIPVGAIQMLSVSERGSIEQIMEVGTDGVVDSVRKSSVLISGNIERIRVSRVRLAEAFGRQWIHLQSQVYPFDIWIYDRQAASQSDWIVTIIKNVLFETLDWSLNQGDWVMKDKATFKAETIYSYRGSAGNPAATGGDLGIKLASVGSSYSDDSMGGLTIEQAADTGTGGRRGALDVPGLIDVVSTYQ
jgi:hypothetical protein